MTYQVALSFEDGVTKFIQVKEGQTVADASYRHRINIPLDCRDGACGTCKAFCESGEYDPGFYIDDALTEDEAEAGYCLPCQMKPQSDLVVQIASTSAVAKTQSQTFQGTLTGLDKISPTTYALTVQTPDRAKLAFLPGQYINFAVPGTQETRSYSFSNGPADEDLTFLVKLTPGGVMSTWLEERAAVGDEVSFAGPNGSFFLRDSDRPLLLLAGGTGLAPILAIMRRLAEQKSTRPVHLLYGATTDDDVVELETIEELGSQLETFSWDYCVADDKSSAKNIGYVTALMAAEHLHDGTASVYLCGPPAMVEGVRQHISDNGLELDGFYYEKFALSGTAAAPTKTSASPDEEPAVDGADAVEGVDSAAEPDLDATQAPEPAADADETDSDDTEKAPAAAAPIVVAAGGPVGVTVTEEASDILGHALFGAIDVEPLSASAGDAETDLADTAAGLLRHEFAERLDGAERGVAAGGGLLLVDDGGALGGHAFAIPVADVEPLVEPAPRAPEAADGQVETGGYEIGEEHPDITKSDAIFDARTALELGAVELTVGRLSTAQLAGYRLLADATLPYVEEDRFVDAVAFTETNAAFHEYLFTLTGNQHLLEAFQALGVQGHMKEVLENATWCDPGVAHEHVEIVEAFEKGDREQVRSLVIRHAEGSKKTMRRAMEDAAPATSRAFTTPGRFDDLVVVVTGSAQGIGEAVARRIGAEGGLLVLADRSELVDEVASDIAGSGAVEPITVKADLESYEGATSVVAAALEKYGRVDVAIHNVGGAIRFKPFHEFTAEEIDKEISRSLMPTLYGCHAVLPRMIEAGGGTIVNVSSIATGGIYRVPYAAAKGGVNAITRSLAVEAAEHGVRVVATAPGGTQAPPRKIERGPGPEGEQEQTWFQAHIDQTLDSALMHRYGTLDEQAAAICFLASPEAAYITGSVLPVGGGDLG